MLYVYDDENDMMTSTRAFMIWQECRKTIPKTANAQLLEVL